MSQSVMDTLFSYPHRLGMSKTSPKTKGRREQKKRGLPGKEKKAHKNQARWKTERKKPYEMAL